MDMAQIQSFIFKFHQLWAAGETAHLDLDTHAGRAWVGLRVQLGNPLHQQQHPSRRQHRSPAYYRRQERRQAAKFAAEETSHIVAEAAEATAAKETNGENTLYTEETSEATIAEKAKEAVLLPTEEVDPNEALRNKNAEQQLEDFACDICDFRSKWSNGLEIHMTRKHATLEQIDGAIGDGEEDLQYDRSDYYWKNGRIGISYQTYIDILEIVESSDLSDTEKKNEKARVTDARQKVFGKNYKNFPPWKQTCKKK